MNRIVLLFSIVCCTLQTNAQKQKEKDFVKIHVDVLQHVTQGASIKLPVKVVYKTSKEQTGFITLSILNHDTQKSIDGWCINIFPFQYFTTIAGENFTTEFPFTIPSDYLGKMDVLIKAEVGLLKDSTLFTFPIFKK